MAQLASLAPGECSRQLADQGLRLKLGPFVARVRTPLPDVATSVERLYAAHELADTADFIDFDVAVRRVPGPRRWWQPQVAFHFDGDSPFNPLPGDQGFPVLEWGLNWCVYALCHQTLNLHAAVLERGGRALILPAPSGSGKSTLCAGLALRGWRLLSDELALISPADGRVSAMPRPVSLKNQSIDVIQAFEPTLSFGSRVRETSKGEVAHFAPPTDAVRRAAESALPGWIVFPTYVAEKPATLQPLDKSLAFMRLVENAFNYDVYGVEGFELLGSVIDRSSCFSFEYGHLEEAVQVFDRLSAG